MLALLALEATTLALQYDGPSTIYLADKELAERLDNRRVRWGSVRDPASRVLRKVFRLAHERIRYRHHEAVNRVDPDPEQDAVHQGCWLAGQVAAGRPMEELSDVILVDDHVVTVALQDILLRERDGDTWTWAEKGSGALTLISSQEAADQARMEMALASREEARRARGEPARWNYTTTRYAAAAWELPRLS